MNSARDGLVAVDNAPPPERTLMSFNVVAQIAITGLLTRSLSFHPNPSAAALLTAGYWTMDSGLWR